MGKGGGGAILPTTVLVHAFRVSIQLEKKGDNDDILLASVLHIFKCMVATISYVFCESVSSCVHKNEFVAALPSVLCDGVPYPFTKVRVRSVSTNFAFYITCN